MAAANTGGINEIGIREQAPPPDYELTCVEPGLLAAGLHFR
jgi:hypothetical protein